MESLCNSQGSCTCTCTKTKLIATPPPPKKVKVTQNLDDDEQSENVPSVTQDVRQKILKWSRDFNKGQFSTIEEGRDYSIQVSKSATDHKKCVASIICRCGKQYKVTEKPTGEKTIVNWSKHLKKCNYKKEQSIQSSLQNYFETPATTGCQIAADDMITDNIGDQRTLELLCNLNELPIHENEEIAIQPSISQSTFTKSEQYDSLSVGFNDPISLLAPSQLPVSSTDAAVSCSATNVSTEESILKHLTVTPITEIPITFQTPQPSNTHSSSATHQSSKHLSSPPSPVIENELIPPSTITSVDSTITSSLPQVKQALTNNMHKATHLSTLSLSVSPEAAQGFH